MLLNSIDVIDTSTVLAGNRVLRLVLGILERLLLMRAQTGAEMEVPGRSSETVIDPSQPNSAASQSVIRKRLNKATSPVWNYFQQCNIILMVLMLVVLCVTLNTSTSSNNTSNLAKIRLQSNRACWLTEESLWLSFLASPSQACSWMENLWGRKERDEKGKKEAQGNHSYNPANISICDREKEWVSKWVVVITFDICCWDCTVVSMLRPLLDDKILRRHGLIWLPVTYNLPELWKTMDS